MIRAAQLMFSLAVLAWLTRQSPEARFIARNKLQPAPMWRRQSPGLRQWIRARRPV